MTDDKRYISTFTRPIATELDRGVAFDEKMLFIKSHHLLITWIHQVIWQIKNVIYPFPWDFWPLIWAELWSHKLSFFVHMTMPAKLEMVMAYEKRSTPTMVTWHNSRLANKKSYISVFTWPMTTKLNKVMPYGIGSQYHKAWFFDHVIICSPIQLYVQLYIFPIP